MKRLKLGEHGSARFLQEATAMGFDWWEFDFDLVDTPPSVSVKRRGFPFVGQYDDGPNSNWAYAAQVDLKKGRFGAPQ